MQSVWIGIWSLIEDGGDGLNMKKWDKLQRGVEKAYFSISHDHAKFSHSHAKWNRKDVGYNILREKWKAISHDHAKFSHSHAKWNRESMAAAYEEIVKKWFRMIMRNFRIVMRNAPEERNSSWLILHFAPSCEITRGSCESAFSPDSLMKKHPKDL